MYEPTKQLSYPIIENSNTIIEYDEKQLYEFLLDNEVPLSAINQIMKLHSISYPLRIFDALNLTTNGLRNMVSIMNTDAFGKKANDFLNLEQKIMLNLTDIDYTLKNCIVSSGWSSPRASSDLDIDMSAFLLNSKGKVTNVPKNVVYYNQSRQKGIFLENSNSNNKINISLDDLDANIDRIVFVLTIFDAEYRKYDFSQVDNVYIEVLNADNKKELCRFKMGNFIFASTAITLVELYKKDNNWRLLTIGETSTGDLSTLLSKYVEK